MKKVLLFGCWFLLQAVLFGQTVSQKLQSAYNLFMNDPQLKYAVSSLYVIDAATGQVLFDKNSRIGLADASTQKIITSATAFELLGKDYRYHTKIGYRGRIVNDSLDGDLVIQPDGDPTFGSWRYPNTTGDYIFQNIKQALVKAGIKKAADKFYMEEGKFYPQVIPDGWIWQDIGNYYGAGAAILNWNENQYDLILKSEDQVDRPLKIISNSALNTTGYSFRSYAGSAPKGSGDNAYIYLPFGDTSHLLTGTIPVSENNFSISGAVSNPPVYFVNNLREFLTKESMLRGSGTEPYPLTTGNSDVTPAILLYHSSPSLDSIVYWFLKKSINLYGEALIKTMGEQKMGMAATETGVVTVKDFWKQKGIDPNELNIYDGSGLSPMNRVTTHAQVEVLKYAKKQDWFPAYLNSFPEYNGMSMKSGSIGDVKGFAGYHTARNGKEYIFSFLVNNYNGSSSALLGKMYKVLDTLK